MTLAPLLSAAPAIQIHAFAAMAAFGLGLIQFVMPKGRQLHRLLGWTWVGLMAVIAGSSLFIHTIRMVGPFSPIHLLSVYVLVQLPLAVLAARRHQVRQHKLAMAGLFIGALIIAGVFTFWPGRIMHHVLFGA